MTYIPANAAAIAKQLGYCIAIKPSRSVRGWPTPSLKPVQLSRTDGSHIASFVDGFALRKYLKRQVI